MHNFYKPDLMKSSILDGDEFHHCVNVLRHQVGDNINITDGLGNLASVKIWSISKKMLGFKVLKTKTEKPKSFETHLYIAPTKNIDRMEWMIEKLSEVQLDSVTFMTTVNSERKKINIDRLERKCISALKQSKSPYKTTINPLLTDYHYCISNYQGMGFICHPQENSIRLQHLAIKDNPISIFIGPEGGFTINEVTMAKEVGIEPVILGATVMRTETASLLSCHTINMVNGF